MPDSLRLFDLFGDFTNLWPVRTVKDTTGELPPGQSPSPAAWLGSLNSSVRVADVRTGAAGGRVSVEARLHTPNGYLTYSQGWPFCLTSMPEVLFRALPVPDAGKAMRLFASVADSGVEVVLEGVPVEILLPGGLVEPHPQPPADSSPLTEKDVGGFTAGSLDELRIVYRQNGPTSIFVHVRIHVTEDGQFEIMPAVPISFEACLFSGVPVTAVHDFRLIPSPELAPDGIEWLRHSVMPWSPMLTGPYDGLFSVRSLDVDTNTAPLREVAEWLRGHRTEGTPTGTTAPDGATPTSDSGTELVIADLVLPWWSPWLVPIPLHATVGLRRRVLDPADKHQVYDFAKAPANLWLSNDPAANLIVESLFYRSQPLSEVDTNLGLTFVVGIAFGPRRSQAAASKVGEPSAIMLELAEHYTPRLSYRRQFLPDGTPAKGQGALGSINELLHFELVGTVFVDIMAVRIGYSLGRALGENASFGDCAEGTVDLWVSMPPSGSETSSVRLRALSGEHIAFAIEGLGWRQGDFHLDGLALPDGVVAMFGPVGIIIQQIGLVAEQGASYLSFTAGVLIDFPAGFEGGVAVRRLRGRVAGDATMPAWKLDGIFMLITSPTVRIEAGGYYTDEIVGDTHVREFGFTGTVELSIGVKDWTFGVDLISGRLSTPTKYDDYSYFMIQAFFRGEITIAWFELRGARFLYSNNTRPKLSETDPSSRELRYYNWYKGSNPLTVPGDRRLQMWQAEKESWSFGIGASASIAQLGKAIELTVFVLAIGGPTEGGVLVVAEVLLMSNPNPVGFAAIEWDGRNDRFSLLAGVDLRINTFFKSAPDWLADLIKITGTLYICNDPATVALGRLADERTWLSISYDWDLWVRTYALFAICYEYVGSGGPKGFGVLARLEGGINAGIVRVTYHAGFSFILMVFSTGSSDYTIVIVIEVGLRIILFGFLRFGISAGIELRAVGVHPVRGELRAVLRLETPWFLPDVTWEFALAFGSLEPESLATSVQPLRSSAANGGVDRKSLPVHLERADSGWDGEGAAPVHSITELRVPGPDEATRLANFAANEDVVPVPTDATIPIEWSVAVNDGLALSSNTASGLGNQKSGDLGLTYELVAIAFRRRPRFGSPRPWTKLEERVELEADFTDPDGVELTGEFSPHVLTKFWDLDVKADGQTATKKLLINAKVPFDFATKNPESDEQTAHANPAWPCCGEQRPNIDLWFEQHQLHYHDAPLGTHVEAPRLFSDSQSWLRWLRPTRAKPGTGLPAGTLVATCKVTAPGIVMRAELDEDAAFVALRLLWPMTALHRVSIHGFDTKGKRVALRHLPPGSGQFTTIVLPGQGPIRRVEVRMGWATHQVEGLAAAQAPVLALDWAAYLSLAEYLSTLVEEKGCGAGTDEFTDAYEGKGKLFWLPNHEYEIATTTRVTVSHPAKQPEAAEVTEYVYFRTKGLPGLNAVNRVGDEVQPYVASTYSGGWSVLYRHEPLTIAFTEDLAVAVPVALRGSGSSAEHTQLLRLKLLARPEVAIAAAMPYTAATTDWLTANRTKPMIIASRSWQGVVSTGQSIGTGMRSSDQAVDRLAGLTQRDAVDCGLADPREVIGSALIAPPQGTSDPEQPGAELWPARTRLVATVRLDDSGHVDRQAFAEGDETAFTYALDAGGGDASAWSLTDGELTVSGSAVRRYAIFGEDTWDHLTIVATAAPGAAAFGIGAALPSGPVPSDGLFAMVETGPNRLVIYRRNGGGQLTEQAQHALPAPADPAAPVSLEVTTYDDELRAGVGDVRLAVPREENRAGRVCLVAKGSAAFRSLDVHGLDMYVFTAPVSRFRSFTDHVHSFDGTVDEISPDALGPSTTTTTVAALHAATHAEIGTVMASDADPSARQALFDRWVAGLGLPLRDEVVRLALSAVAGAGGTTALLLESPEPIDFTGEVTVTMSRRVKLKKLPVPRPAVQHRPALRDDVLAVQASTRPGLLAATESVPTNTLAVRDVLSTPGGLRVELTEADGESRRLRPGRTVTVGQVRPDGDAIQFHRGTTGRVAKGIAAISATRTDLPAVTASHRTAIETRLAGADPGTVAVIMDDLEPIVGPWLYTYEPVDIHLLSNRNGERALVVPVSGDAAVSLTAGTYRLTLKMARTRWATTDAPDDINQYQAEAVLTITL